MRDLMRIAIRYATEALQRFASQLRLDASATASTSLIAAFIHEVAGACGNNRAIINLVLSPLLRDGHIIESDVTRSAIAQLSDSARGILCRAPVNRREAANRAGYRITSRYAGVLTALRTYT
jgi:hypothetical protein